MRDFNQRLAVAFALMAGGVAGFVSMYVGALVSTALVRALIAGIIFFIIGKIIASALYLGPQPKVGHNIKIPRKESGK